MRVPCVRVYLCTCLLTAGTMGALNQEKDKSMSTDSVQDGVVVSMEYTLHVDDEQLDTSEGQGPLQFFGWLWQCHRRFGE